MTDPYGSIIAATIATIFCYRRVRIRPRSPLNYNPDDPSTFPVEEKKKAEVKEIKEKREKREKKSGRKEAKNKSKETDKAPVVGMRTTPEAGGTPAEGSDADRREADDLETVNMMKSAWGEVQEQNKATDSRMKSVDQ
ncbi:hypothetical protein RB195_015779 [Necator americanus]|uniref:Uncharacterized protein n=1 Tax=Necator americanus TaxID=51031 RepID=A0ABR1E647_NECAM